MSNSISSLVRTCLRQLEMIITSDELDKYHSEVPPNLWSDELGRLRVWTANMGAHHIGQKSLDYRLRDASHLKDQTLRVLRRLERTIHDLETYIHGTEIFGQLSSESESDEEDQTELQQTYSSLQDTINLLFKASRFIRRPAQHDRILGVKRSDTIAFEPFDRQHVADKFPLLSDVVIDRLGLAISQRRAVLRYRERHHLKLAQGLNNDEQNISSAVSDTVATEFCQEPGYDTLETQSSISQTSYAGTIMDGGEGSSVPPPPIDLSQCDSFECPYCFLLIDVQNKRSWVKHVFNDLLPYICVFPDCRWPHRLYESRREWYAHLRTEHSLNENGEIPMQCPLCHQAMSSGKSFQRHVGRHLQELALFALPKPGPDKDEELHKSTVLEGDIQSSQSDELSMMHWQAHVPHGDDDDSESDISKVPEGAWSTEELRCVWKGCQYTGGFPNEGTLMRHIKSTHVSPDRFACEVAGCGKKFGRKDKIMEHVRNVHGPNG